MATSITYSGLTWTFSADKTVGAFANGEPWVVGPVSVTNISPGWTGTHNGTVKNFTPITTNSASYGQGWVAGSPTSQAASRQFYSAGKNVGASLPISLVAGDVITTLSTGWDSNNNSWGNKGWVLTVLSSAPAAGSFRPAPYGGINRSVRFNTSQINTSFLPNLAPVSATPTVARVNLLTPDLPWIEVSFATSGAELGPQLANCYSPREFLSNYGREVSKKWGEVGLWLCTQQSAANRTRVIIATIQAGIDLAGYFEAGGWLLEDGGHKTGRKFPVVFAAKALNDAGLISHAGAANKYQEDRQTFMVTSADVGRAVQSPNVTYTSADVGKGEWSIRHASSPHLDDRRWSGISPSNSEGLPAGGTSYRNVVWWGQLGPTLAAELMGLTDVWNHPAIFSYNRRYATHIGTGDTLNTQMWGYLSGGTPPTQVAQVDFSPVGGNQSAPINVVLTSATVGNTIRYTTNGSTPTSSSGTVYSAPIAVSATTTIKAIAYKSGSSDSVVTEAMYSFSDYSTDANSSFPLLNVPLGSAFTANLDLDVEVTPSASPIDALVGLSSGDAVGPSSMAGIIRFNPSGNIDARNGGSYAASNVLAYSAGVAVLVEFEVDVGAKTYNAWATVGAGARTQIATAYAFRTEQAGVSSLNNFAATSPTGSLSIDSITTGEEDPPADPPQYSVASGNYATEQSIEITGPVGATIRIETTTNGSEPTDPTVSSDAYTVPLVVSPGGQLRAKATSFVTDFSPSTPTPGAWTVDAIIVQPEQADSPEFSHPSDQYDDPIEVEITCEAGGTIYYTDDGSEPTDSDTEYTVAIEPADDATTVIKAIVYAPGKSPSGVVTRTYVIGAGVEPPDDDIDVQPGPTFSTIALTQTFPARGTVLDVVAVSDADTETIGGLSSGTPAIDSDVSIPWRISGGVFECLDGADSTWKAANVLEVEVGDYEIHYSFTPTTYSVKMRLVATPVNAWVQIATNLKRPHTGPIDTGSYRAISHQITVTQTQRKIVRVLVIAG